MSENHWGDLDTQVSETIVFLKKHRAELERLREFRGVDSMWFDFGFDCRLGDPAESCAGIAMQGEYLPPELLDLAGKLKIGIGLSIYPKNEFVDE